MRIYRDSRLFFKQYQNSASIYCISGLLYPDSFIWDFQQMKKHGVVEATDIITNDFLSKEMADENVSSTLFDKIFLPHSRVPAKIVSQLVQSAEAAQALLQADSAIYSTIVHKPYWRKDPDRNYDAMQIDVYGAVALAPDRSLLDNIIAHGSLIRNAEKYTLRQVITSRQLGIEKPMLEFILNKGGLEKKLLNRGIYYHVPFTVLLKSMGLTVDKNNRVNILKQLHRLSVMHMSIMPMKNSQPVAAGYGYAMSLIDKEFFAICDSSKVRNKGSITPETYTDLIVNISDHYVRTLPRDGKISRSRVKKVYSHLNGKENIEDFFKYLDSHKREYLHNKSLQLLIYDYLKNKAGLFGINLSSKTARMYQIVLSKKESLVRFFNIRLIEDESGKDMKLLYINTSRED